MGITRFSINAVLWFGDEMRKISGIIPGDDEEFMSCIYPTKQGMSNAWNGDAIVSHFAFFTQREQLDKQNILEQYGKLLETTWKQEANLYDIYMNIQQVMTNIQSRESELSAQKSPYRKIEPPRTIRSYIKRFIPKRIVQMFASYKIQERKKDFIID